MTIKEAILTSIEEIKGLATYMEVLQHIHKNKYVDFGDAKTPGATVSAQLGDFIRSGDTRIKRVKKQEGGGFFYYHAVHEGDVKIELLSKEASSEEAKTRKATPAVKLGRSEKKTYDERSLHMLLSTFLWNAGVYSKTIFHEQSAYAVDGNQTWTHPDVVGIRFLKLHTKESQNFLKVVNRVDTFKISSYEIKKEINTDSDLKKAFFQAVSNSSWANYGYLVAFEISDSLKDEMERLNQSFGIGVIELSANPYQSKFLYPARLRDLDFKTIDKLCKINKDFKKFIEQAEKLLTAEERYVSSTERELVEFCDKYLATDTEVEKYCKEKNIPIDEE